MIWKINDKTNDAKLRTKREKERERKKILKTPFYIRED